MPMYGNVNSNEFVFVYEEGILDIADMLKSIKFPQIQFTTQFNVDLFRTFYGVTPAYWQNLSIMYNLINDDEIKKFISRNNDDLKILLLYIPLFVQKEFPKSNISLKLVENPDTGKDRLRAYIHTSFSPSIAAKKLDIIDDLSFNIETEETLYNFLLDVEFE